MVFDGDIRGYTVQSVGVLGRECGLLHVLSYCLEPRYYVLFVGEGVHDIRCAQCHLSVSIATTPCRCEATILLNRPRPAAIHRAGCILTALVPWQSVSQPFGRDQPRVCWRGPGCVSVTDYLTTVSWGETSPSSARAGRWRMALEPEVKRSVEED